MRIGVFSNDTAGSAVALLVARGLASVGEPVDVAAEMLLRWELPPSCEVPGLRIADPSEETGIWTGTGSIRQEGHLVAVLPLDALGAQQPAAFDVVLTAGRDHPASARALRAARYTIDEYRTPDEVYGSTPPPPAWFVPCSHQAELWTKATLASTGAMKLPFATRAIPFMVPRLEPEGIMDLMRAEAAPSVLRAAVLLASVVSAIATDPHARGIDAAGVAAVMAGQVPEAGQGVVARLLALATEFERLDASAGRDRVRRPAPLTDRRRPGPDSTPNQPRRRQREATTRRTRHMVR